MSRVEFGVVRDSGRQFKVERNLLRQHTSNASSLPPRFQNPLPKQRCASSAKEPKNNGTRRWPPLGREYAHSVIKKHERD